jgi:hypothetical protein
MIDEDIFAEFESWYNRDVAGDPEYAGTSARQFLARAEVLGHLDDVLALRGGNMSLREWVGINIDPMPQANPFPDVRRKGGDHDRGFSPALNQQVRRSISDK